MADAAAVGAKRAAGVQPSGGEPAMKRQCSPVGPLVWWLRNDLRLEDNPVLRRAAGEAFTDARSLVSVFIFDPRFLDKSDYGRVTDPKFEKSITTRRPISFSSRKCSALRARFWLQCVRKVGEELRALGNELLVCHGHPEEVLAALPQGSSVLCQQEPVSVEATDVEVAVADALEKVGSELQTDWGAMSLYHREDLPFRIKDQMPGSYSALGMELGWKDIWTCTDHWDNPTRVREPVPAPSALPRTAEGLKLPGMIPSDVLADEAAFLSRVGYSEEEIKEAMPQEVPQGGEPAARAHFAAWLSEKGDAPETATMAADWDLPISETASAGGHDRLAWANLSKPHGWTKVSHYLAVGCISAREIFARTSSCANFTGVVHRLLWREWHRLNAIHWGRRLFWLQGPGRVERPWTADAQLASAWKEGRTGIPYIDACMRELRTTGWLAYKGRKTAGHFLVFDLGVDWRLGAFHYEETLMDYDCAMNYGNWVTVAQVDKPRGTGDGDAHADMRWKLSAEQANDSNGEYIRQWVAELKNVPSKHVHTPWLMSEHEMQTCGCVLGKDYPSPLVDLAMGKASAEGQEDPAASLEREVATLKAQLTAKEEELSKLRSAAPL